jgi:hypothetical protein
MIKPHDVQVNVYLYEFKAEYGKQPTWLLIDKYAGLYTSLFLQVSK